MVCWDRWPHIGLKNTLLTKELVVALITARCPHHHPFRYEVFVPICCGLVLTNVVLWILPRHFQCPMNIVPEVMWFAQM